MTAVFFIGIDIARDDFTWTLYSSPAHRYRRAAVHPQTAAGFAAFERALAQEGARPDNTAICLEATGVYGQALCYALTARGWRVAMEAPHKVKRAFHPLGAKTDAVDSRQIAEYAHRFADQLSFWTPPDPEVERLRALLTTREQLTGQLTASQNALKALQRHPVRSPGAEGALQEVVDFLKRQIKALDQRIKAVLVRPAWGPSAARVMSVPGVGPLLTAHLLVLTRGFERPLSPRSLAAHLGICPLPHQSGVSVHRPTRSRRAGPARLRKLLYLASMSLKTHVKGFTHYFLRKRLQGKPTRLVLNNIANKLLRIICAVLKNGTTYIPDYKSVPPLLLQQGRTA